MNYLLEVFTTSYNEPKTVTRLIEWYRKRVPECLISVFDNESDDNGETKRICKENNVRFSTFSTNGEMDEGTLIMLRNYTWKNSPCRFAIVCDSDELVDVWEKDLIACNDGKEWNVCKCHGVELYGTKEDTPNEFWGVDSVNYSKSVLFHIPSIRDMNFAPGSHTCNPVTQDGVILQWCIDRFNLYHTKMQFFEEGLERNKSIGRKGRSQHSKSKGWGVHYDFPEEEHRRVFNIMYKQRKRYL